VFLANPEALFKPLSPDSEVEGTIIDFSDSGSKPRAFAVVEVVSRQTMVIPVERLKLIPAASDEGQ
jgi:hypothetical protein